MTRRGASLVGLGAALLAVLLLLFMQIAYGR